MVIDLNARAGFCFTVPDLEGRYTWCLGAIFRYIHEGQMSNNRSGKPKNEQEVMRNLNSVGAVMVVGGGIAGVQASLDLAELGYKVYLVDSSASIGGVMGQLDKTFPTNDCSMCILSPKLVEAGSNDNIEVITLADVLGIEGEPGCFDVILRKNPRFVDIEKCTGCGICTEHCRVKVKDPYNAGLSRIPLIRVPFPQAVPGAAFIDPSKCLQILKGKCGECLKHCPAGAINFSDKERIERLRVGSVIIAGGFKTFDPRRTEEFGYGVYENVITSLEFERILAANGPTGGHVVRRSDSQPAEKIAFIQCVGSRDSRVGNVYCSSVCCMYATKQAIIAREHDRRIKSSIFYIDFRAHGKGFEEYRARAEREYGVRYVRCLLSTVKEIQPSKRLLLTYVTEDARIIDEEFDLVVLSVGLTSGVEDLASNLEIDLNSHGFIHAVKPSSLETSKEGIYVCGAAEGPKDIPESVVQASAAAGSASSLLWQSRGKLTVKKEYPPERDVRGETPRIGAIICRCGTNIGGVVDVPAVVHYAGTLPGVVFAEERLYACSQDAQVWIKDIIEKHNLNRLVVASCTPRTHQPLFRETVRQAGLNKYLFEMANIREHCSWVHMNEPERATEKAKQLVLMAVKKASLLEPLEEGVTPVNPVALVIGGGPAGMSAALRLADAGFKTHLVERDDELGGNMKHVKGTLEGDDVKTLLEEMVSSVMNHPLLEVHLSSKVTSVEGYVGSYTSVIQKNRESENRANITGESMKSCNAGNSSENEFVTVDHGVIVVAVGAEEYQPRVGEYMFGLDSRVVTQTELERRIFEESKSLEDMKNVVMIQCVGSRNEEHPYCSRICCGVALKNALELKKLKPSVNVVICYRDIRAYGLSEEKYLEARESGVKFVRFSEEEPPIVNPAMGRICVLVKDKNMRDEEICIYPDIVVLSCGAIAREGCRELGPMLKVPLTKDGFFLEAHVKLRPVEFATDGVFLAGMAHYPKTIRESILSAQAAAAKAEAVLSKDRIVTEGVVARIDPDICIGCGQCVDLCSYGALELDRSSRVARVNPSLCKGCGACTAACVSGANQLLGFKSSQIYAQIEASCAFLETGGK